MGNISQIIGENIKNLMDENKVTKLELAKAIGVTRQTLAKYISGEAVIDSEKLFKIAEYFNKPITYFLDEKHEEFAFMFRAHNPAENFSLNQRNKIQVLMEKVYEAYKLAGEIISYIPEQYNIDIDPNWKEIPSEVEEIIEQIAIEQRDSLDAGENVGDELIKCFEAKGIRIIFEKMKNPKLFGLSAFHEKKGCFIFINDDEQIPEERKIFSIVHEYAHLLFHRHQYRQMQIELQYTGRRKDINEKIADAFAGYFLIPRKMLKKYDYLLKKPISFKDLLYIKKELKVSLKSLIHALKNYGYISKSDYTKAMQVISREGYSKIEPEPMAYIEKNKEFESIVRSLFQKNVIGVSKVAELLGIRIIEARQKIEKWIEHEEKISNLI